ncbi:MAG: beta-ketoacyl-ACP synthase III [Terriglobales bacterium]
MLNTPYRAKITALGTYVPPRELTNADLEKMVDTSDEWIMSRTGIRVRHIADPGVAASDLATCAARRALTERGIDAGEVEAVIVGTVTPDMLYPSTACLVQHKLGIPKTWGYDLSAGCSGFLYSLTAGAALVCSGFHKKVLVIGSDVNSSMIDYTDRATCVLFGDGAGAVLLEPAAEGEDGIIDFAHEIEGAGGQWLCRPGGGSLHPAWKPETTPKMHFVHQDGQQVFKYAVRKMAEVCLELLERNGYSGEDVDCFVPHQANLRIIKATGDRLKLPNEKVVVNIDEYGNTTAGTLPLALETARRRGQLKKGSLVLLAAVGAGFTSGATLLRWAY